MSSAAHPLTASTHHWCVIKCVIVPGARTKLCIYADHNHVRRARFAAVTDDALTQPRCVITSMIASMATTNRMCCVRAAHASGLIAVSPIVRQLNLRV